MSRIKLYKPFEHWQEKGNIWIISDTHFEDADCRLMDANWIEPEEHIKNINAKIRKGDTLIHLGDIGNPKYLRNLNKGIYKVLICGNHDAGISAYEKYFNEIYETALIIAPKIILSHERLLTAGFVNIHGHEHSGPEFNRYPNTIGADENRITVGVNLAANKVNYQPWCLNNAVKGGLISKIDNIHRLAIEKQKEGIYNV